MAALSSAIVRSCAPAGIALGALALNVSAQTVSLDRDVPAEQQAAVFTDPSWKAPLTSWGDPDLTGVWSIDDMRSIPRQRAEQYGDREQLTPEEFAERAAADEAARIDAVNGQSFAARREVGVRTYGFTSVIVDPPNGRYPALTEAGRASAAASNSGSFGRGPFEKFDDFTLYDRCITRGIFGSVLPSIYGNGIRIAQSPDSFLINYEMIHETRVIPLDDRPNIDTAIRPYTGNGRGYWDGDTLIVESANFTDKTGFGFGGSHSDQLKLTETYTRIDPELIRYTVTVEDPVNLEAPFTYRIMFSTMPDGYELYEYSCHEGNVALPNTLNGARVFEREVAEALANGEPPPEPIPFRAWNELDLPDDETVFININAGE